MVLCMIRMHIKRNGVKIVLFFRRFCSGNLRVKDAPCGSQPITKKIH